MYLSPHKMYTVVMNTFNSIKTRYPFYLLGSPLIQNVDLRGDAGAQRV